MFHYLKIGRWNLSVLFRAYLRPHFAIVARPGARTPFFALSLGWVRFTAAREGYGG